MKERLQKIIAGAGITSRRKAESLILSERVTVNGRFITELGAKVDPEVDHIKVDGKLILPQPREYFAFHKPRCVLSAVSDTRGRRVVVDYIKSKQRLYPAGRLDFNSEGLLILTNDGDLARSIMKAGSLEKVYRVKVVGSPSKTSLNLLMSGIQIKGEVLKAHKIRRLKSGNNCWFEVVLKQGKNRQIRKMFEQIGHGVMRLRRTSIGPVQLGELRAGQYRRLTVREIALLSEKTGGQSTVKRETKRMPTAGRIRTKCKDRS